MNKMVNKTLTCCPPGAYFLVLVVTLIHVDLYSQWLHKKNSAQRCTWESPSPTVFHHQLSTGLWSYGTTYYPRPNPFLLRQLVIGASRWGHGGVGWGEGVCRRGRCLGVWTTSIWLIWWPNKAVGKDFRPGHSSRNWTMALLLLFSHSVASNFLWPLEWHHTRLPVLHHLPKFA